ncbi:hypothetical protein MSAN_01655100 [Mycena sanguinolenta]|uniref:Uncharacterized protein n=1 Tax=Mycena sanguinolenta TaxID=230812 RepID=A0A8H6Y391_9AGAR|nr:hypothetical protein MSAN_01655100 [Mycena sanguinolenta]
MSMDPVPDAVQLLDVNCDNKLSIIRGVASIPHGEAACSAVRSIHCDALGLLVVRCGSDPEITICWGYSSVILGTYALLSELVTEIEEVTVVVLQTVNGDVLSRNTNRPVRRLWIMKRSLPSIFKSMKSGGLLVVVIVVEDVVPSSALSVTDPEFGGEY